MAQTTDSARVAQDIELWLGSPWRRALLATLLTLLAAGATSVQASEVLDMRKREYEWSELYLQQLCVWLPWALLGGPLVYFARWSYRLRRRWWIAAAIQVPTSLVVGQALQLYEDVLSNVVFVDTWLSGIRPVGQAWFRFTRELLVYWLVLASGAAIYSFLKSQHEERRASQARLRQAQLEAQVARTQLDTLRSQLHPHFLFNALHSVGGLVREGETQRALQMLSSVAALLRATLDSADAQETRLEEELAVTTRYLEIERVRFGERLRVELDVDPAARQRYVPALFLLTLAENAVRHAASRRVETTTIWIRAGLEGERVKLTIEDDGPGFPPDVLERGARERDAAGAHIGLVNTRRRLSLLYGEAHVLRLENRATGGARVVVELPPVPSLNLENGVRP